jgi:hypothetical protein
LHLEELQSDWHQQGRDKGYKDPDAEQKLKQKDELKDTYEKLNKRRYELLNLARREPDHSPEFQSMIDEANGITPKLLALNSQMHDLEHFKRKQQDAVPDAPFKKNWEEMALKRLIHHAAEKGYHGVVVTPGVEQAKRYNIGDRIGYLGYHPEEERLKAYGHDRLEVMNQTGIKKEDLPSHIGKEVADRLLKAPQVLGTHQLEGEDIHVGGKGMKGFYDTKVPNILNSIGKKYGVKTQLGGHRLQGSPEDYSNAVEKLGIAHIPMAQLTPEQNQKIAETADKRLHHFPITEEMRKDVLTNGLPLYNKGGTVHMADGGDMDTMQMELMNKKMSGGGSFTTKGYVTHEPQKPHPEVGTRFKATPQGNLSQMQNFDLMKHEGKGSIVPIPYDATTRDNLVTEVSGHNLINPLLTEAGFDYSLDPTHMAQNIGGASSRGISRRVQRRVDQAGREHEGDVFLVPNTMSEDAENFSHHPAHIVLDLMAQRQLKNHTLQALSDDLRGQPELKRNAKTGITIKTYPYTNFLGYDHPNMMDQVMKGGHGLGTSAGNLRKKMMERLSLVKMQKLLDYNMGDLKASILDPDIATDPKAYMGRTFVKAQRGAALRPGSHGSYDTNYTGTNVGGLGANRPLEILMPDVTESIYKELNARPAKTVKTPAQMRAQVVGALEKRKENFSQPINARVINNAGLYEQGLKQGEFDPKNVESVLAYFRRKGGYKKGGKIKKMADGGQVDVQSIGVNEAPNMDVKAYFPPRPAQGSMLPVGGIQQAQQAPMQPPPPMPNQPQQQPSPAPIQVGQPPSNILQMTPQGQAMNAIKPPQMARGGKVDRDTMMLALMNRNKKVKYG